MINCNSIFYSVIVYSILILQVTFDESDKVLFLGTNSPTQLCQQASWKRIYIYLRLILEQLVYFILFIGSMQSNISSVPLLDRIYEQILMNRL